MLDRDVQNHLGRRLRAYYATLPGETRAADGRKEESGSPPTRRPTDLPSNGRLPTPARAG